MELYSAKDICNLLVVWRDSSMVKSIHYSRRELRFTSQQFYGGLQLSITPIPLDWMPSSGFFMLLHAHDTYKLRYTHV